MIFFFLILLKLGTVLSYKTMIDVYNKISQPSVTAKFITFVMNYKINLSAVMSKNSAEEAEQQFYLTETF